jgi:hypothetical protein
MKWVDGWAARAQRFADRRDEHYRRHQEAVRAGTTAPTLIDRASASSQRLVQADDRYFQQLCQVIQVLTAGPVSGPDGTPVRICLSESVVPFLLSSRPPKDSMPKSWLHAIATERTLTGQAAAIRLSGSIPTWVYAYALSGPPHQVRHRFRYGFQANRYVLALAQDVRSRGVSALNWSSRDWQVWNANNRPLAYRTRIRKVL